MNYIVSTIQYNAVVNKALLRNMLLFADNHKVDKIYLYVMQGKHKDEEIIPKVLFEDPRIELLYLGKEGIKLNRNLKLHDTGILASQINPLTGFQSKLSQAFSFILPSPKIRFLPIPSTGMHPRFLATTGALTHGNYKMHIAQGRKAALSHEYGFAFVKIRNGRLFNHYQVDAMKNGNFHHYREYYKNGKVYDEQPEALVLGDWHVGDTCPKVRKETIRTIENLDPKRVFFHDFFNGHSVNHHEMSNHLSKARMWSEKMHVLEREVEECLKELQFFCNKFPKTEFFIVESNHDQFLNKYIGEENFLEDGQNSVFACKMFVSEIEGDEQPTLKTAMQLVGELPENVKFLVEDEDYRIKGVGLGHHGHRGLNGARGSGASFDRFNLKLITGHEHTPKVYANGMVVGTSTTLKLNYTKGPSSWMNAHGLLYSSGKYTLLTMVF